MILKKKKKKVRVPLPVQRSYVKQSGKAYKRKSKHSNEDM